MEAEEARRRFAGARVARLATVGADGRPHLVPIAFACVDDVVWSAVDDKPKRTRALRRLDNVRANPRVALLADHYDEDWSALWWVRADGVGAGGRGGRRARCAGRPGRPLRAVRQRAPAGAAARDHGRALVGLER